MITQTLAGPPIQASREPALEDCRALRHLRADGLEMAQARQRPRPGATRRTGFRPPSRRRRRRWQWHCASRCCCRWTTCSRWCASSSTPTSRARGSIAACGGMARATCDLKPATPRPAQAFQGLRARLPPHRPAAAIKGRTPTNAPNDWHRKRPELFTKRAYNHAGCDTYEVPICRSPKPDGMVPSTPLFSCQ